MKSLIVILFLFLNASGFAQTVSFPPPAKAPEIWAVQAAGEINVDGFLTEADWANAPLTDDFFMMEPRQAGPVRYQTAVKILFDQDNIYFGVFCKDSVGKKGIRVQDFRRDFVYGENDVFYLQLDPQNLRRFCVSFQATPYGSQRDLQVFDDSFRDNDWDALWKVRTAIVDSGYFAEFAIPFKSLRYDEKADNISWGVSFARMARRDYEVSVFPAIPQAYSPYRMNYAAQIKGLKLPAASVNLRIQPYTLYQNTKATDDTDLKINSGTIKAGGELKWAVSPSAVLDATVNTDFAQADVDRAVNNLTRFNLFFPERRQFFLENSGVYAGADITNVKPFFSRTIGLANAQFNAGPVPIDAGVRYTDRNQKRTLAGLYVHQRGTPQQAGANFGVLRYLKNYGKQNNIGVMLTHRLDEQDNQKGFDERNNTTVSLDGFVRPKDDITIQYIASAARNNSNDSIGLAGSFYAGWFPNKWYAYYWTDAVGRKYTPGMGYVFANNTIRHSTGGYYIWRPKKLKFIRRFDPGVFVNYYHNADGFGFQQADMEIFPIYIVFQNGSFLQYSITPTWQNINFDFGILGAPIDLGRYFYTRQKMDYNTDQSSKLSFNGSYEYGSYYNGRLQTANAAVRIAPYPYIAADVSYNYNRFHNFGSQDQSFNTSLITAGLRLAANPRVQLSGFYQYNSFNRQAQWNVRGSWEFMPLSFIYLVFNDTSFRNAPVQNQSLISKISFLKQF